MGSLRKSLSKIKQKLLIPIGSMKYGKKTKVFCIGRNKTGTTSMNSVLKELGFIVADQHKGELLMNDWKKKDFTRIVQLAKYGGTAFQDYPFSAPETYKALYKAFPDAKFILTVRDNEDVWYNSVTSFHAKIFGNGKVPDMETLKNANYVYPGWMWEVNQMVYKTPKDDIYNPEILKNHYLKHNKDVQDFFKDKPGSLLVINLKEPDAMKKVSDFLGIVKVLAEVPWENKTLKSN